MHHVMDAYEIALTIEVTIIDFFEVGKSWREKVDAYYFYITQSCKCFIFQ